MVNLAPLSPLTVFIADDSAALRRRVTALIASERVVHIVGEAGSVQATVDGLRQTRAEAAVLDFQFDDGTALDVLQAIAGGPPVHVAVLTFFVQDPYRDACLAAGAEYFLDKSTDFTRLREIVRRWHALHHCGTNLPTCH
jgi:DNA-binding NarL/FixJ family response regulator